MLNRRQLFGRGAAAMGAMMAGSMLAPAESFAVMQAHPFTTPIPLIDPLSDQYVQVFVSEAPNAVIMADADWGMPLVKATTADPLRTVKASQYNNGAQASFYCPDGAPISGGEGKMVIFGPRADGVNVETDLFGAAWSNGILTAEGLCQELRGVTTSQSKPGAHTGITGSNIMQAAGLLLPSEVTNRLIPHALAVTIPETLAKSVANSFRWPATWSDGTTTTGGIPMGAHIVLDPAYDVSTLAKPWVRALATAFIQYGGYVMDTGGHFAIYAESSLTAAWPSDFNRYDLRAIDWARLRVLTS